MAVDIVIPSAGESVTNGVISRWLKAEGDIVKRDEPVLELETDKVTMEVPAPASGAVKHAAKEGDTVDIGAVVGSIDEAASGSAKSGGGEKSESKSKANGEAAKPQPAAKAESGAAKPESGKESAKKGAAAVADKPTEKPADTAAAGHDGNDEIRATPVARKLAAEHGINLANVPATGAGNRIREQDVLAFIQSAGKTAGATGEATRPAAAMRAVTDGEDGVTREKMSPLRQRIASRLVQAQHTAAMLTTFNEVDMSAVMSLRKQFKEEFEKKHGIGLGFMGFFVKAAVSALKAFPMVNAYIVDDASGAPMIEKHEKAHIAVAVSTPKGLVVPVIRDAGSLSFAGIEESIKEVATRARDGKLTLEDMQGGTFTITNGGVFGSLMSTPILNPPQSAILGMHTIKNRPVEDPQNPGQIVLRPMMYLAISYDHRIIDGAEAVQFLVHIKKAIEDPQRLLLNL